MGETVVIAMAVVAIVLIAGMSINGLVDKMVQARRLRFEAQAGQPGSELRDIAERQQLFEERLRVLERIATDRGSLLADEIEALRSETLAITKVKDTA
ncbi:MAG: hypothetical protein NBV68_17460 [Erythrobacter sp.]|uniref:hypothetical protein n=1 Tax=Erythrobacter sp. TaxID=1042 RepID=UPI0025D9F5A7|nr:hypothetical protein [Erythrobacter sp.]MCM0001161.1 hypothetical protein [Erythrobacter sp.]